MRVVGRLRASFVVLLASALLAAGCGSDTRDTEGAGGGTAQGLPVTVYGVDADITQHPRMDVPQITVIPRAAGHA